MTVNKYQIIFLNNFAKYMRRGPCYKAAVYPVALSGVIVLSTAMYIMSDHVENKSADWKTLSW